MEKQYKECKEKINEADFNSVYVRYFSRELDEEDKEIINYIKNKKHIVILNKIDLDRKLDLKFVDSLNNMMETSAKTGFGMRN